MELLYPLMQAYDSVQINADVELVGQIKGSTFNGKRTTKEFGQKMQIAITMPILVGTDGVQK